MATQRGYTQPLWDQQCVRHEPKPDWSGGGTPSRAGSDKRMGNAAPKPPSDYSPYTTVSPKLVAHPAVVPKPAARTRGVVRKPGARGSQATGLPRIATK